MILYWRNRRNKIRRPPPPVASEQVRWVKWGVLLLVSFSILGAPTLLSIFLYGTCFGVFFFQTMFALKIMIKCFIAFYLKSFKKKRNLLNTVCLTLWSMSTLSSTNAHIIQYTTTSSQSVAYIQSKFHFS